MLVLAPGTGWSSARSSTPPMVLRPRYAMSGTEKRWAATRWLGDDEDSPEVWLMADQVRGEIKHD
eukprot:3882359-Rhodomonas_salina.3